MKRVSLDRRLRETCYWDFLINIEAKELDLEFPSPAGDTPGFWDSIDLLAQAVREDCNENRG